MSLWRDELRVGLCPDRLTMVRYAKGLRSRIREQSIVPVNGDAKAPAWKAPLEALAATLAARSKAPTPNLTVILSSRFVRYALLPFAATLRTEEEWLAYARHAFAATHGSIAGSWQVRVCSTGEAGPRLACASDAQLLESIAALPGATSIQPYLISAFNARRHEPGMDSTWFVALEPGRLAFALIERGIWKLVRTRSVRGEPPESLAALLEREAALAGMEPTARNIIGHAGRDGGAGSGPDPQSYAMALA